MRAERFKFDRFFVAGYKAGHCRRRQQGYTRCRLRNSDVAHMANLAMLLVGSVSVPMPGRLHRKQPDGKNQGDGQHSRGDEFFHLKFCKSRRAFDTSWCKFSNIKPAGHLHRALPAHTKRDSRRIRAPAAKSILRRLRLQMVFAYPSRCRWKAQQAAGRDTPRAQSS